MWPAATGQTVYLDSNIFIYGLLRESEQCAHFLERCHRQELRGATTLEAVGEVCHVHRRTVAPPAPADLEFDIAKRFARQPLVATD